MAHVPQGNYTILTTPEASKFYGLYKDKIDLYCKTESNLIIRVNKKSFILNGSTENCTFF